MTTFSEQGADGPPETQPPTKTSVVYLLWAPLGLDAVKHFVAAYRDHPAGADHELIVAACGHGQGAPLIPLLELLEPLAPTIEIFEGPRIDLRTYREVVGLRPDVDEFVFIGSNGRPLADNWLKFLLDALRLEGVGVVGATGSYESFVTSAPWWQRWRYLPTFARFPNPHIRTTGFALTRESIELLDWRDIQNKLDAWRFENGRGSATAQLIRQGRRPLVVGRDGKIYEADDWQASHTYRAGEQENLLIADSRTDDYANADAAERAHLAEFAWGP